MCVQSVKNANGTEPRKLALGQGELIKSWLNPEGGQQQKLYYNENKCGEYKLTNQVGLGHDIENLLMKINTPDLSNREMLFKKKRYSKCVKFVCIK